MWLYVIVLKSFAVYIVDIYTATTMLSTSTWSNEIFNQDCEDLGCVTIPFETGKWLFVGCIIFSFLLVRSPIVLRHTRLTLPQLGYESYKSRKIVASRDISYAFTNVMANNYYSIRTFRPPSPKCTTHLPTSQDPTRTFVSSTTSATLPRRATTLHSSSSSPSRVRFTICCKRQLTPR